MCRWSHPRIAFVLALFAMIGTAVSSDSVTLKTGKVLEGTIVSETNEAVEIEVGGMTLKIARSKVASIDRVAANGQGDSLTTGAAALERLEALELESKWADLYEAAVDLLRGDPKNAVAAKKKELAQGKIREALGGARVAEFVRERRFDDAIAFLTERLRSSDLQGRGAGAVGQRALAELHLAKAEAQMRVSLDGHAPLAEARKARELDPTAPRLDFIEGMAQIKLHHFKQATELLESAAKADPDNFGIRLPLMQCYDQSGDHTKIVQTFEAAPDEARASADRWPEVRRILAKAYMQVAIEAADKGTTPQAAVAYDRYLSFTERTPDDLRGAIRFFERVGDFERAQAVREERLRGAEPESPDGAGLRE